MFNTQLNALFQGLGIRKYLIYIYIFFNNIIRCCRVIMLCVF